MKDAHGALLVKFEIHRHAEFPTRVIHTYVPHNADCGLVPGQAMAGMHLHWMRGVHC